MANNRSTSLTPNIPQSQEEIDVIEKANILQAVFSKYHEEIKISVPRIVVIGEQSSGKSSVIEGIFGKHFLPKGTGTVTRCPIIIQFHQCDREYVKFGDEPMEWTDFEAVKREIAKRTNNLPPGDFSRDPIFVKVHAPTARKLSLVDLPGIIQTTADRQKKDNIKLVREIALDYIKDPNSLILAVLPGDQEFQNSFVLNFIQEADPKRERTIGVLTKMDLVNGGKVEDTVKLLKNQEYKLIKGYVGVVNCSLPESHKENDARCAFVTENEFFAKHPTYRHMKDRMGNAYLQNYLCAELKELIKDTLPSLKEQIEQHLKSLQKKVKETKKLMSINDVAADELAAQRYFSQLLGAFKKDFKVKIFGKSNEVDLDTLSAGAVINYHLYTRLQEILRLPTCLSDENLINLIPNDHGIGNVLFIPSSALEIACKRILEGYLEKLESLVDSTTDILIIGVNESMEKLLNSQPSLKNKVSQLLKDAIFKANETTKDLLGKYIKAEQSFCNIHRFDFDIKKLPTDFPSTPVKIWASVENEKPKNSRSVEDFSKISNSELNTESVDVKNITEKLKNDKVSKLQREILSGVIKQYITIIQKQIQDISLKYIICFLVNGVSDFIENELTPECLSSSDMKRLFAEYQKNVQELKEKWNDCQALEKILSDIKSK